MCAVWSFNFGVYKHENFNQSFPYGWDTGRSMQSVPGLNTGHIMHTLCLVKKPTDYISNSHMIIKIYIHSQRFMFLFQTWRVTKHKPVRSSIQH